MAKCEFCDKGVVFQAGEQRRCGGLKHGDGGEGDPLQRIGDGGLYQDGAPVACGSAQYGCGGAVIDPLGGRGISQRRAGHRLRRAL